MAETLSRRARPDTRTAAPIRVMFVEDSGVARALMTRWIEDSGRAEVVLAAGNGREAIDRLRDSGVDIDVIVLDVEMPELSGIEALPQILALRPGVPVLMASALTDRGACASIEALRLGAADTIGKPRTGWAGADSPAFRLELVNRVLSLGEARRARPRSCGEEPPPQMAVAAGARLSLPAQRPRLVAIGASTGGPRALFRLVELLPQDLPAPVVITQHMPPRFTDIFAQQLARAGALGAAEAVHGEPLLPGRIYVAPGDRHLLVGGTLQQPEARLSDAPAVNFCRPSVDPMFASAASLLGPQLLAVVLTGMGTDGLAGAREVKAQGGTVIAQDPASSVVWGMPGAVVRAELAAAVLGVDAIAEYVARAALPVEAEG